MFELSTLSFLLFSCFSAHTPKSILSGSVGYVDVDMNQPYFWASSIIQKASIDINFYFIDKTKLDYDDSRDYPPTLFQSQALIAAPILFLLSLN
ncbi:hypothetical protein RRF57_000572 [Xylaria bambusicola]|uniref:Uncharacterized protein n=1 Tax=Xylaria bambusicola TaxID=326684 RepID=A0AAN7UFY2_9PEZI